LIPQQALCSAFRRYVATLECKIRNQSPRQTRALRIAAMVALAFGVGLYSGVHMTARGYFKLPLGPMADQLQSVWGYSPEQLRQHDQDGDGPAEASGVDKI
jgi:hypothetical protein